MAYDTIIEDGIDILVVGAGLGGTGAAWEARFWGKDKKIVIAEKANIDRPAPSPRACTRSTATWARAGARTSPRTTCATRAST